MPDMNEWIRTVFAPTDTGELSVAMLLVRLLVALVLGLVIAGVYRVTRHGDTPTSPTFIPTLVMLCILLAIVTQVIGNSAALAFSLVGILSIVRFRTTVEDTRDTAFVIFAVVIGMASGVGNFVVALVGLVVVAAAAVLLRFLPAAAAVAPLEWTLLLRVSPGAAASMPWEGVFARSCESVKLLATGTARQGAALDLTFQLSLKAGMTPMQFLNDLNRIDGIQNVEMKRTA